MASLSVLAGDKGLRVGDELTFFYPSTEWDMAQGFSCFCGTPTCRGTIKGAKNMSARDLEGVWLNPHIRQLLEERDGQSVVVAAAKKEVGKARNGLGSREMSGEMGGDTRRGVTSRELSGEMGGDTLTASAA
jgi:hypothetical protein